MSQTLATEAFSGESDRLKQGAKNASPSVFRWVPRASRRLETVERDNPSRLALFRAVYEGRATRNQCIKAQCLDCQGFDSVGVKDCSDRLCPLWKFRPFQRKENDHEG